MTTGSRIGERIIDSSPFPLSVKIGDGACRTLPPKAGNCCATGLFFFRPATDIHQAPALSRLHVAHDACERRLKSHGLRASPVRMSQLRRGPERSHCHRSHEIGFRGVARRGPEGPGLSAVRSVKSPKRTSGRESLDITHSRSRNPVGQIISRLMPSGL